MILDVVIVSYNGRDLLRACLRSLHNTGNLTTFRIIVIDNASEDGAPAMVRASYPVVELIENRWNMGFARAVNIGLLRTQTDFVLLLNPDTEVPAGALDVCLAAITAQTDVAALSCKLVKADGTLDHACKRGFPTPRSALAYFAPFGRLLGGSAPRGSYTAAHIHEDAVGYVDAINGAFMLIRRTALQDIGLLDEDYWMYGEDLDWCYRAWSRGWRILYWPRVSVLHVKAGSSGRRRSLRTNLAFHRSMWLFYRKHYASRKNIMLTGVVWLAIWMKLGVSVAFNWLNAVTVQPPRDA
jgi:GT2 family glycosyltransferase